MRVALYTRVSTEDQAREGYSLEVQRNFLLQYAKSFGWEVFCSMSGRDVYMDDGRSIIDCGRFALLSLVDPVIPDRVLLINHTIELTKPSITRTFAVVVANAVTTSPF